MGGRNPYIDAADVDLPTRKYTITFVSAEGEETVVEVDPAELPYSHDGLPGSLLDVALGADLQIDHACGGVCACSTCHVVVEEGEETCNPSSDAEEDMLDNAPGLTDGSRLACQCVPNGSAAMRVVVPSWNRNLVQERPH